MLLLWLRTQTKQQTSHSIVPKWLRQTVLPRKLFSLVRHCKFIVPIVLGIRRSRNRRLICTCFFLHRCLALGRGEAFLCSHHWVLTTFYYSVVFCCWRSYCQWVTTLVTWYLIRLKVIDNLIMHIVILFTLLFCTSVHYHTFNRINFLHNLLYCSIKYGNTLSPFSVLT